jgi:hypothetical protein
MAKGDVAEKVVEEVAENLDIAAENLGEAAQAARGITPRDVNIFFAGAFVGVGIGIGLGYFALKKRVTKEITEFAEGEIDKIRKEYRAKLDEHLRQRHEPVLEKPPIAEVVEELGYDPATGAKPTAQELIEGAKREHAAIKQNIFEEAHPEIVWDYAVEIKARSKDEPYVIHVDEFNDNEHEYEQTAYTYYEGDDILSDVRDTPVEPVDMIVGLKNLQRFGHGSNDINCVYVRNDELKLDMEINRTQASFAEEVHGFIEHSEEPMPHRRRGFDDD